MNTFNAICSCILLALISGPLAGSNTKAYVAPDRLFDMYGAIRWEDEMARLDNFAFVLQTNPDLIGYILVYNGKRMCPGEAQARAMRAKRYVVERRGIESNRVIWREEGYHEELATILQPAPRSVILSRPLLASTVSPDAVRMMRNCRVRINRIRKSKW